MCVRVRCLQCLIPEVPFKLHGERGLFAYVEKVLSERGHCVVCVAEGAGQVRTPCCVVGQCVGQRLLCV